MLLQKTILLVILTIINLYLASHGQLFAVNEYIYIANRLFE